MSFFSCNKEEDDTSLEEIQVTSFVYRDLNPRIALKSYDSLLYVNCGAGKKYFPISKSRSITIDLDLDRKADFYIDLSHYEHRTNGCPYYQFTASIRGVDNNRTIASNQNWSTQFIMNDTIQSNYWALSSLILRYGSKTEADITLTGTNYIGIRILINDKYHYGYIKLSFENNALFFKAFAINRANSELVIAGQENL